MRKVNQSKSDNNMIFINFLEFYDNVVKFHCLTQLLKRNLYVTKFSASNMLVLLLRMCPFSCLNSCQIA